LDRSGLVDAEPVLRHFSATKRRAVEVFTRFVEAGIDGSRQDHYYRAAEGQLLGSEEFLEQLRHRVGEHRDAKPRFKPTRIDELLRAAESSSKLSRQELCSKSKDRRTVAAREALIVVGRERGISNRELARALGIDPSAVTRRIEAARMPGAKSVETVKLRNALRSNERSR